MSKIDLAIEGSPSRQPVGAAVQRNVRLWLCLLLLVADMAALATGFALGLRTAGIPLLSSEFWQPLAGGMIVYGVVAFHNQAYNPICLTRVTPSLRNACFALAGTLLIFLLVVFSLKATGQLSRLGISAGILCSSTLLVVQRLLIVRAVRRNFSDDLFAQLLIIDGGTIPHDVSGMVIVDAEAAGIKADLDDPYMLHRLGTLLRDFDRVVISCPSDRKADWAQMLKGGNILGEIIVPELDHMAPLAVQTYRGVSTLVVARGPLNLANRAKKRLLDIAITVPLLIALAPLIVVIAIAIRLDSPGPIFFKQERIGRGNRLFHILKFRSMRVEQCDAAGAASTLRDDNRITRVGAFIRKTSIDELPQLINVLLGEMSLVGPRPHALGSTAEEQLFWQVDRQYWHRHALKPGITGLAQIRGFRGATETRRDILNRVEADLEYLHGWSLMRDIAILFGTFNVLVHRNAY
ncbi:MULTISPECIES: exopolysaccharide biosynthesis polyprenyl glycosylphosphotransferase [Sphingobium]|uniref:Exopolysaccharide biosynthesis polyprenyl glycosylphosphotransferase n=1 Tax=Sphingobium tyrosinilyticum TaxID=2715436 RepID=A0ABV9F435_9SPHN|nr:exopolysaccharide biosynthesis polyprenyl glycosylphosphotransferase [Sphingobium sp. EP60837]ANI76525.1 Putative undecaprenyl-phosphate N-acetylgalactosaminyl 1-phosphate transferase [Sphingobium sp. EP60837]